MPYECLFTYVGMSTRGLDLAISSFLLLKVYLGLIGLYINLALAPEISSTLRLFLTAVCGR